MNLLDLCRIFSSLAWMGLFVYFSGSLFRLFVAPRPFDPLWSIIAVIAIHQIGYFGLWLLGWVFVSEMDTQISSKIGLHIISGMCAIGLIYQRILLVGKKW